jgi:hypothetical protein
MRNRLGLSKEDADYFHSLHPKWSYWIANVVVNELVWRDEKLMSKVIRIVLDKDVTKQTEEDLKGWSWYRASSGRGSSRARHAYGIINAWYSTNSEMIEGVKIQYPKLKMYTVKEYKQVAPYWRNQLMAGGKLVPARVAPWLSDTQRKAMTKMSGVPLMAVIDFFKTILKYADEKNWDLSSMTFKEATRKVSDLAKADQSEDKGEVMLKFKDGHYWINLNKGKCSYEQKEMGHCGSDNSGVLWSLRDKRKKPHVTMTVNEDGVIIQLKGKENKAPKGKYLKYIVQVLAIPEITGMDTPDFDIQKLNDNQKSWLAEQDPGLVYRADPVSLYREFVEGRISFDEMKGKIKEFDIEHVIFGTQKFNPSKNYL